MLFQVVVTRFVDIATFRCGASLLLASYTEMTSSPPQHELVFVVQQATARVARVRDLAVGLGVYFSRITVVGTDLYLRRDTDVALIAVRVDARYATRNFVGALVDGAARVGVAVLEPARLPDEERRRYHGEYLPLYDMRVPNLPSIEDAAQILVDLVAGEVSARQVVAKRDRGEDRLEVRFLRGDDWQLARARSLTRDAIYVTTGGPPRAGDVVDIALSLVQARHQIVARGAVVHVTPAETAATLGAAGFGARFLVKDGEERQRIDDFLRRVRTAQLGELTPPPRRREVRYPVRWPVYLGTADGTRTTAALDVSRHGLFVAAEQPFAPQGGTVDLAIPLDDSGEPLRARARIARALPPQVARTRGVRPGFGLELVGLATRDEGRFVRFLQRVSRRAERCIVVGAEPRRAALIVKELCAAGYNAVAATDAPSLVGRAAAASRPPDLVMLDASLTRADARADSAIRRALAVRHVPTLYVDEETPTSARSLADVALLG